MNRRTRTALVTAAVAGGTGVLLLATPVLAGTARGAGNPGGTGSTCPMGRPWSADGSDDGTDDGTGYGMGRGTGRGTGGMMRGSAGGPAADLPARGTLTAAQKTALAGMAEEEKLAHDVYIALAPATGDRRFTMIARSETGHLAAVRVLLDRYGVADPTAGTAAGVFTTPSVQALYTDLVAKGSVSPSAAPAVGRTVETTDIADLAKAGTGVTAADVTTVYQRLAAASQHHLAAFGG